MKEGEDAGCGHNHASSSNNKQPVDRRVRDYFLRTNLDLILLGIIVAGYSYHADAAAADVDSDSGNHETTSLEHQVERAGTYSSRSHASTSLLIVSPFYSNPSLRLLVNRTCCFLSVVFSSNRHRCVLRPQPLRKSTSFHCSDVFDWIVYGHCCGISN